MTIISGHLTYQAVPLNRLPVPLNSSFTNQCHADGLGLLKRQAETQRIGPVPPGHIKRQQHHTGIRFGCASGTQKNGLVSGIGHSGHLVYWGGIAVKNFQHRDAQHLCEGRRDFSGNGVLPYLPLRHGGLIAAHPGGNFRLCEPLFFSCWAEMTMHGAQICA